MPSQAGPARLSAREYEVLRLIADGLTNEAIGSELGLALKTIEAAIRSIFVKIGLLDTARSNRRVLAARWFLERGVAQAGALRGSFPDLVGRAADLRDLDRLITSKRFVTITGAGGIGKTRLAVELATQHARGSHTRLIDLAPADELSARQRVFDAFGLQLASDAAATRLLIRALAAEPHFLILDNVEHVVTAVRRMIPVLTSAIGTILVVTSREPLGVSGEHVWRTPPMSAADSAALLVTRMVEAGSLESLDGPTLDAWCIALDGMPLAIELAAARLATLPVDRVVHGQNELPTFLHRRHRSRHSGLADVLHDSFARVPAKARDLARSLAVFRGGFTLAAAQTAGPADSAEDSLSELVLSSLLEFNGTRYRMLEPVRQFIADQMTSSERPKADLGLVRWCADFAAVAELGFIRDPRAWRVRLEAERDNIDAALDAAVLLGAFTEALRIMRGMGAFWSTGAAASTYARLSVVLACVESDTSVDRAWGLVTAGVLAVSARNPGAAGRHLNDALDLFRAHSDADGIAVASYWLARPAGSVEERRHVAELAGAAGNHQIEGWGYLTIARDEMRAAGTLQSCLPLMDRAEGLARSHHLPQLLSNTQLLRAEVMLQANWLDQGTFSASEIDALLAQVELYNRQAGGAVQHADYLSIATTNHLHHRRWEQAGRTADEQLEWAERTEDPVVIAEAILMAAVVLHQEGHPDVTQLVRGAGPTFAGWSGPLWLAFTLYPAGDLYSCVADLDETVPVETLVSLAELASRALATRRPPASPRARRRPAGRPAFAGQLAVHTAPRGQD